MAPPPSTVYNSPVFMNIWFSGGIACPRGARAATGNLPASEAEPFGEDALAYTKLLCMQREVQVQVEGMDKAGNFIGWLWIGNTNLSVCKLFYLVVVHAILV